MEPYFHCVMCLHGISWLKTGTILPLHQFNTYIIYLFIFIINIKEWTFWSVPSPESQLLAPTLLQSSDCSPSLWSVVVWFQRYWPQGILSMPIDNNHKSWEIPSDMTAVSSASKFDFLTSSIVIPGQCNFSCSREERKKASPRSLETETFG